MAQKLTDMIIDEISIVDDPANEQARVVITKMKAAPEGQTGSEGLSGEIDTASADQIKEFQMDMENLAKALEDAEAKLETLEKRTSDAEAALADATEVIKAKEAEIEELQKSYAAKAKPKAKAKADEDSETDDEDDVMKSLAEPIRKRLEAFEKRAAEAEATLAKMRDEKDTADAIAKAKSLNFGKAEEIGPLLMRVTKGLTTAADAELLERLFKAAGEQGKVTHLFKSVGSDVAVDGDPEVLIKAKAGEIQKANNGMTFEQAYAKAMEENPSLYNAYVAKRRAG